MKLIPRIYTIRKERDGTPGSWWHRSAGEVHLRCPAGHDGAFGAEYVDGDAFAENYNCPEETCDFVADLQLIDWAGRQPAPQLGQDVKKEG